MRGFFRWLGTEEIQGSHPRLPEPLPWVSGGPDCAGARLRREARDVRVGGRTIDAVSALTVKQAQQFCAARALGKEAAVAEKVLREIERRLSFLSDVGLDYLTLDRLSSTLSGGESQRINLATSLGSALVGTLRAGRAVDRPPLATTSGLSTSCRSCGSRATRCWSSSTTRT